MQMNNKIKPVVIAFATTAFLAACGSGGTNFKNPVKDENYSSGDLDLSRYVALGDSLTAGYKDGTLYLDGQFDSFPNILAGLFEEADGGVFTQPLVGDNLGGLLINGADFPSPNEFESRIVLTYEDGEPSVIRQSGTRTMDVLINPLTGSSYNNLGVPGAKSFHLTLAGYGNFANIGSTANPYAVYLNIADGTNTILGEAAAQAPTFFTLWVGNNDILGYGTSGGTGGDSSTSPAYGTGSGDITDPVNVFAPTYNALVTTLTAGGASGVLINIPSIVDIPFFTTVPFNAIPLDAATAAATNAAYATYNGGLATAVAGSLITQSEADQRTISFAEGQNAIVMEDDSLTDLSGLGLPSIRQATADDYILLSTSSLLGTLRTIGDPSTVIGVGSALTDAEALTATEAAEIEAAREAYNTTIAGLASANDNLALFDAAALLADLSDGNGISYGTGNVDSTFATGGAFSLDGVHPTAKGYAIIANGIIDTLNESFNADLPKTDPNNYTEVFFEFPAGFDFSP